MNLKKHRAQGQVLIFAVVIMIILLVATLFLFDLHTIIRSKIKLETAEQSAALAAAKWQARSLNLIGDINLIKAADSLLDDYGIPLDEFEDQTAEKREIEQIKQANRILTEMQSRISFCGPLIAFGAAQQAAKNNGVNIYDPKTPSGYKIIYSDLYAYLKKLNPTSNYPRYEDAPVFCHGYKWRTPYMNMLTLILKQGLAVRPNARLDGLTNVNPRRQIMEEFYNAIVYSRWCNRFLNEVIKFPDSYWNGKWYQVEFGITNFPKESEIYTLGVDYKPIGDKYKTTVEDAVNDILKEYEIRDEISFCIYDTHWNRYTVDKIDNGYYDGPDFDLSDYWAGGKYLRYDLKSNMFYGGAIAYAECYQYIPLINKYRSKVENTDKVQTAFQENENGEVIIKAETKKVQKVGSDAVIDKVSYGAVAKPIADPVIIDDKEEPPTKAIIVLPLFNNVAIIPSTMQSIRPLQVEFSKLEKFVIWFSTVDDLHNPGSEPPEDTQWYLKALQKLDDPTFRKTGWNNDYVRDDSDLSIYFKDDYKYNPQSNPNGAGWLQQIYRNFDASRDPDSPKELEEVSDGGTFTRIYYGQMYILKDSNGKLQTNEKWICWPPGGPGPGPGPGAGPSNAPPHS